MHILVRMIHVVVLFTLIAGSSMVPLSSFGWQNAPAPANPIIRVALIRHFGYPNDLFVTLPANTEVLTSSSSAPFTVKKENEVHVSIQKNQMQVSGLQGMETINCDSLVFTPGSPKDTIRISIATYPGADYQGDIRLSPWAHNGVNGILIVNELPMETYLRGVLPVEMGADAPMEALKAQAITARTYTLTCLKSHDYRFDVTDTTQYQAYGGADADNPRSDMAVESTIGLVLFHDGKLVPADYYADCGGVTAPGNGPQDYPPSVVDAPPGSNTDYCTNGKYHQWSLSLSLSDIQRALPERIQNNVGNLKDISALDHDISGRVLNLLLIGDKGEDIVKAGQFRAMLGEDRLRSTLFTISPQPDGSILFNGKGWGHGRGLCQDGAMGMASPPYNMNYRQILLHYFPDSEIMYYAVSY
jgi:SpoIID/LytB domain protein